MAAERGAAVGRGFVAGVIGGLAGGWVKLRCEELYPPRGEGREAPPAVIIKKAAAAFGFDQPSEETLMQGTFAIHWIFSGIFGGLYGALAERFPIVRIGGGAGYGLAVWIGAHELAIPVSGFSPPIAQVPQSEQMSEAFSHTGFGTALELTRALVRTLVLR